MSPRLRMSLPAEALAAYVARQASNMFPDGDLTPDALRPAMPRALERLEHCFQAIDNRYFFDGESAVFSHLHGDQYAMWLYLLGNQLHRDGADTAICDKLFLLNKALHGCDIFYEVELPSIFLLVHPLGTVLGRGRYSDYFVAYQRVGVGSNRDVYPRFEAHVTLRPGAAVLGDCTIGANSQIAAESLVLGEDVPPRSIYIGKPGAARIVTNRGPYPLWRRPANA